MKHLKNITMSIVALLLTVTLCLTGTPQTVKAAEPVYDQWTEWFDAPQERYEETIHLRETKTETKYQYSRFLWYGPSSTSSTVTYRAASFRLVPKGWTLNKEVTTDSYSGAKNGKYNVRRSGLFDNPVAMSSSGGWIINGVTYWQEDKVEKTYYRYYASGYLEWDYNDLLVDLNGYDPLLDELGFMGWHNHIDKYQYFRYLWYGPSKSSSTVTYRAASSRLLPSGWTLNRVVTSDDWSGARNGKYNVIMSDVFSYPQPDDGNGWPIDGVYYWEEKVTSDACYTYLIPMTDEICVAIVEEGTNAIQSLELNAGQSTKLTTALSIEPDMAGTSCYFPLSFRDLIWHSTDSKIVSVDNDGNITALKAGTAHIYCTGNFDDTRYEQKMTVTVH